MVSKRCNIFSKTKMRSLQDDFCPGFIFEVDNKFNMYITRFAISTLYIPMYIPVYIPVYTTLYIDTL